MEHKKHHISLDPEAVPEGLRRTRRWVGWRVEEQVNMTTGEVTTKKVPYRADGRGRADVTKPSTWSTFPKAVQGWRGQRFDSIGFVFSDSDDIMGIDLDHCRNSVTGRIEAWAQDIIDAFSTYAEASPSGNGVHIILRGHRPAGAGNRVGDVEMYESSRYFTVTGAALHEAREVDECQDALNALCAELWPPMVDEVDAELHHKSTQLQDDALLEKALRHAKFARLWRGNFTGYGSQSEADAALLALLAWWTNRDEAQMDRLFRRSGLYRSKWECGGYRERSILAACSLVRGGYTGRR